MNAKWLAGLALAAMTSVTAHARDVTSTATAPASAMEQPSPRTTLSLADGWRFKVDGALTGAEAPGFPDADWQRVSVPHTWNRVGYYRTGSGTEINTAATVNKYQGVGWYRLDFAAPSLAGGKRAWLQFDAASRIAEVWLNGRRIGSHAGGFSRFRFDVTAVLRPGELNLLAVRVDNSAPIAGSTTADVLPLTGDFMVRGGLYRAVSLIVTEGLHIDMLDHGGSGVYATTTAITPDMARIAVRTRLRNESRDAHGGTIALRLVDADGAIAARASAPLRLAHGAMAEIAQDLVVPSPHLWQGTADPHLYCLIAEIADRRGRIVDRVEQPFGIRQVALDPDRGFLLNGRPLALHGVGLHQDDEAHDWAMTDADVAARVAIVRDMGANTIRLTHYQHGQAVHELADRQGLVLWDEIPLVTQWTQGEAMQATPALIDNARQQLAELMRQNFNHASVAFWGIANEVDFGPNRPDFFGKAPARVADPTDLLRLLDAQVRHDDPSRPSVLAACCRGDRAAPDVAGLAQAYAVNRYHGWYYGKPSDLGPYLDGLRGKSPALPLAVSEYGAGGALSVQTDDPLGGPVDMAGPRQPEAYQSWFHEQSWPQLRDRPWLYGTWLWNSFDFGSTVRAEGDSIDINTKGLVTYDGRTRKDSFYFYRANWSPEPTVHLTGRRYVDRAYGVVDVRAYSNAAQNALSLNGRDLGTRADCPDRICVWQGVTLDAGANVLVATGQFPAGPVRDRIEWQLAPAQVGAFRIDAGALVAAAVPDARFGSDTFFSGGQARTIDTGGRGRPPVRPEVANTRSRDLAATYREGRFAYVIPTGNGRHTVKLTFMEPSAAVGARRFDVIVNGKAVLTDFDIAREAGGALREVTRAFAVEVKDGKVRVDFVPRQGDAIVSALEIVRRA